MPAHNRCIVVKDSNKQHEGFKLAAQWHVKRRRWTHYTFASWELFWVADRQMTTVTKTIESNLLGYTWLWVVTEYKYSWYQGHRNWSFKTHLFPKTWWSTDYRVTCHMLTVYMNMNRVGGFSCRRQQASPHWSAIQHQMHSKQPVCAGGKTLCCSMLL